MTRCELLAVVQTSVHRVVPEMRNAAIHEDDPLLDLGADSLEIIEVIGLVMKRLEIAVPSPQLARAQQVKDLLDLLQKYTPAPRALGIGRQFTTDKRTKLGA